MRAFTHAKVKFFAVAPASAGDFGRKSREVVTACVLHLQAALLRSPSA